MKNRLNEIAHQINAEHAIFRDSLRKGLRHAKQVGDMLLEAKDWVEHGKWTNWVRANCKFSPRTARMYIRISRNWEKLETKMKTATVADLTVRDAVKFLAENSKEPAEKKKERYYGKAYQVIGYALVEFTTWEKNIDYMIWSVKRYEQDEKAGVRIARRAKALREKLRELEALLENPPQSLEPIPEERPFLISYHFKDQKPRMEISRLSLRELKQVIQRKGGDPNAIPDLDKSKAIEVILKRARRQRKAEEEAA